MDTANTSTQTPLERMNERIAFYRERDDKYKKQIKEIVVKMRTTDYTKWKCVELRAYLRKELEDEPESRVGLSKWRKGELIDTIKEINDNLLSHKHHYRQEALWNILKEKIRYKCYEQGITDKRDLVKIEQNYHHKCCDKYNTDKNWLFLLNPENYSEVDDEISTYQFSGIMKYPF